MQNINTNKTSIQNKAKHLYKTKQNIYTKQTKNLYKTNQNIYTKQSKTSIQNIAKHLYMYKINSYMNSCTHFLECCSLFDIKESCDFILSLD